MKNLYFFYDAYNLTSSIHDGERERKRKREIVNEYDQILPYRKGNVIFIVKVT
jgi:hypothetical protein